MIETRELKIENVKLSYLKVNLPKAPLVMIIAPKGYVMCGYLNIDTAERLGQAAATVRGVSSAEEILNGKIAALTSHAKKLGIKEGMVGKEAIRMMI